MTFSALTFPQPVRNFVGTLTAFALTILLVGCLAGCTPDAPDGEARPPQAIPLRSLGVVLDGTGSTSAEFNIEMRDQLSFAVGELFPPIDEGAFGHGVEARGALDVYVYCVGEDTTQYGNGQHHIIRIAGYPSLSPAPSDVTDPEYASKLEEWSKEKSAWVLEYQNSCASAQAALDELASIQASTNEYSGIYTTVSALSRVLPKGSPVIVFSDLENSADITVDGSLAGSPVFAVQPYIYSDMELEEQFKREFIEYLVTMGVSESDVKFFAPEQAHDALTAALNWPTEA